MKLKLSIFFILSLIFSHSTIYGLDKYTNDLPSRPLSLESVKEETNQPKDNKVKDGSTSGCPQAGSGEASASPSC